MSQHAPREAAVVVAVCLGLFLPVHAPMEMAAWLGISAGTWVLAKKLLFGAGLLIALIALLRDGKKSAPGRSRQRLEFCALTALIILAVMVPFQYPYAGLTNSGVDYAKLMAEPFDQSIGWFYRRLLPIVIPYLLGVTKPFNFVYFAYAYVGLFVIMLAAVVKRFMPQLKSAEITLITLTLASPLITFAYRFPGYPEFLGLSLYLARYAFRWSRLSASLLVVLSLEVTDQMLFFIVPLELFLHRHNLKSCRLLWLSVAIYMGLWLVTIVGFKEEVMHQTMLYFRQTQDGKEITFGVQASEFLLTEPGREFMGVVLAHKLMWYFPLSFGAWHLRHHLKHHKATAMAYGLAILASLTILVMAVDTSRLAQSAMPLIFLAMVWALRGKHISVKNFVTLAGVNFLLPSVNYFAHTGWEAGQGIYTALCRMVGLH